MSPQTSTASAPLKKVQTPAPQTEQPEPEKAAAEKDTAKQAAAPEKKPEQVETTQQSQQPEVEFEAKDAVSESQSETRKAQSEAKEGEPEAETEKTEAEAKSPEESAQQDNHDDSTDKDEAEQSSQNRDETPISNVPLSFRERFERDFQEIRFLPNEIIPTTVVEVGKNEVVVDAGLKSTAVVPVAEFQSGGEGAIEVEVGDKVEVQLLRIDDGSGEMAVSRIGARQIIAWNNLEQAHQEETLVKGTIMGRVKGGFSVDIDSIRAFLPGSLVDLRPVSDIAHLQNESLEFIVIKVDRQRGNVVVSRRAALQRMPDSEREAMLEHIKEGAILEGHVKNLTDYGVFVDVKHIDGLLHITDMSWERISHPSEMVSVGDTIKVRVLRFDPETLRVSLGLKQLEEDPWLECTRELGVGSRVSAKVTNITEYGCFVEMRRGVEGLVHASEMDWVQRRIVPSEMVSVGDEVDVMVLAIDEQRRRISLGMRQCKENPWETFKALHQPGDEVAGKVERTTEFGLFIGLEGGVDGLIHVKKLPYGMSIEKAKEEYPEGSQIECVVVSADAERRRIALAPKPDQDDPFGKYIATNPRGTRVSGIVNRIGADHILIDLEGEVQGVVDNRNLSEDTTPKQYKVGSEVSALVKGIVRGQKIVDLSIRMLNKQEQEQGLAEATRRQQEEGDTGPTLGDVFDE